MKDSIKIQALSDALKIIAHARDFHAEYGRYPYADESAEAIQPDQAFDDFAADVAEKALHYCNINAMAIRNPNVKR